MVKIKMHEIIVDKLTLFSIQIELLFKNQNLSYATGFVIEKNGK